jgi:hypothetical protein
MKDDRNLMTCNLHLKFREGDAMHVKFQSCFRVWLDGSYDAC